MIDELKANIPPTARQWSPPAHPKRWLVSAQYAAAILDMIERHYGTRLPMPAITVAAPHSFHTILEVRYIGSIKRRADNAENAYGWIDGQWTAIFPKDVLYSWFGLGGSQSRQIGPGLFRTLGIALDADDSEIKAAYRRLAKQWHPDYCREENAATVFQEIQAAYETLRSQEERERYKVALLLTGELRPQRQSGYWSPPLRCGWILCKGTIELGKYHVTEIEQWEDITNGQGQTLVTTWDMDANGLCEYWV
jgi:hypothetical protein